MQVLWKLVFSLLPELNLVWDLIWKYTVLGVREPVIFWLPSARHLPSLWVLSTKFKGQKMISQDTSALPGPPPSSLYGSRMFRVNHFIFLFPLLFLYHLEHCIWHIYIFKSSRLESWFFSSSFEFSPLETIMGLHQETDNIQPKNSFTIIFLSSEISSVTIFHISFTKALYVSIMLQWIKSA